MKFSKTLTIFVAAASSISTVQSECTEEQFECLQDECIPLSKRCDFVDNCSNGFDELDCLAKNTFDDCEALVECGWQEEVNEWLEWGIRKIEDIKNDEGELGPNTNWEGSETGKVVFLSKDKDDVSQALAEFQSVLDHQNSNSYCTLSFQYYHNGNLDGKQLTVLLEHESGAKSHLDYLPMPGAPAGQWVMDTITIGRQKEKFKITFVMEHGSTWEGSVAVDEIVFNTCGLPQPTEEPCTEEDGMFKCKNGACIGRVNICNMSDDCGDESDEYNCQGIGTDFENEEEWKSMFSKDPGSEGVWEIGSGSTSTRNTGPPFDHTRLSPDGKYMYVDAKNAESGKKARLFSAPFKSAEARPGEECIVKFWYHIYGNNPGKFSVFKQTEDLQETEVYVSDGDHGNVWYMGEEKVLEDHIRFRLVFEAEIREGDIAIDDIYFDGHCIQSPGDFGPGEQTTTMRTDPPIPPKKGSSSGMIAAIVMSSLIMVAFLGGVAFLYKKNMGGVSGAGATSFSNDGFQGN